MKRDVLREVMRAIGEKSGNLETGEPLLENTMTWTHQRRTQKMVNCKLITLAKRRDYGLHKHMDLHVDFCSNCAKQKGANKHMVEDLRLTAKEIFHRDLQIFLTLAEEHSWAYRLSYIFEDE
jgi:hypothetical protein